jgi:autonomous glycyl radical cofactor GrcA
MSEQAIIDRVTELLKDQHPGGVNLQVLANEMERHGEYWHIPVQPNRQPRSTFEYYEMLADVETELSDKEHLKVVLVPALRRLSASSRVYFASPTLTPNTTVKVNGVAGRFGDLTPQQQTQLKEAVAKIPALPESGTRVIAVATAHAASKGGPHSMTVQVSQNSTKIMLDINGDKIEVEGTELTPDTMVKVNGKNTRFGDLNATQQEQLKKAMPTVTTSTTVLP